MQRKTQKPIPAAINPATKPVLTSELVDVSVLVSAPSVNKYITEFAVSSQLTFSSQS